MINLADMVRENFTHEITLSIGLPGRQGRKALLTKGREQLASKSQWEILILLTCVKI